MVSLICPLERRDCMAAMNTATTPNDVLAYLRERDDVAEDRRQTWMQTAIALVSSASFVAVAAVALFV